jgi:phage shock protein A
MISQLTSVGEGALGKIAQNPVTHRALEGALQAKERVEKLVGSVGDLESRVTKLEKRLDALDKAKRTPAKKTSATSKSSSSSSKSAT